VKKQAFNDGGKNMSMIRRKSEVPVEDKKMFGGAGKAEHHKILLGAEEMAGKGRLFNHVVLRPGCEIAWHIHHGDCETYYILKGRGEYNNNGEVTEVGPGDTTFVGDGEGHSMKTLGEEPLEMIALVLYT
jgi:Mannose-6-phosphate isomerase